MGPSSSTGTPWSVRPLSPCYHGNTSRVITVVASDQMIPLVQNASGGGEFNMAWADTGRFGPISAGMACEVGR